MRAELNRFSALVGNGAESKGFHQAFEDADWLESLARRMRSYSIQPDLTGDEMDAHSQRLEDIAKRVRMLEVGMKLMLITSELSEALESIRNTSYNGHLDGDGNFGEELADAAIRIGDLAHMMEIQLGDEITGKMKINEDRPYMHGRHA